jgi:fermentation-respiration switch protein FrsA (DUF1100 family)
MRRVLSSFGLIGLLIGAIIVGTSVVSAQSGVTALTLNELRLRRGPGTQYEIITTIPPNTTLPATARSAAFDWIRVNFEGQDGWIYAAQLRFNGNINALPVQDANTAPPQAPQQGGGPTPTPTPPPDGSIESLNLHASTDRMNYYRIVYWSDGLRIHGFYAEPKAPGKYPAVIYNRSGTGAAGALNGMELAPFAETGFVIVASQLRGSSGSEGREEFGGADVNDVVNLVALLKSRPNVDPNRIVMFGSSRGGMMTYIALRRQTLSGRNDIKAAATVGGIADLVSWGRERPDLPGGLYGPVIGASSGPAITARSATYWASSIRVPLLMQHGEADSVVSVNQSRRLYQQLRRSGRVKLITYPGDDHPLSGHTAGLPESLKWFQTYIGRPGDNFDFFAHQEAIYNAYAVLKARIGS